MYKFTDLVYNTDEVIYVNDRNKQKQQKNNVLNTKSLAVIGVVAAVVIAFGVVMNAAVSRSSADRKNFDGSAWKSAVEEAQTEANRNEEKAENDYSQKAAATAAPAVPKQEEKTDQKSEQKSETAETDKSNERNNSQKQDGEKPAITLPVRGAVTKDYSGDELVYSETMQDWRTHDGIDIYAEEGTEVLAAADGIVEAVSDNGMLGRTVIVLHDGGLRTIYSNLAETDEVAVGDEVKTGAKIGRVGATAAAESAEKPHLHFEVSLNEKTVNPHDYLSEDAATETE